MNPYPKKRMNGDNLRGTKETKKKEKKHTHIHM